MATTDAKTETVRTTMHTEEILVAADLNARNTVEFDDPHKAAMEDNPDKAQKVPSTTMLAIFVRLFSRALCFTF